MAFELYTVQQFEDAWFKKDYSVISKDDFPVVFAEYQDSSGLYLTDDFEKRGYILHLSSRLNYVRILLRVQRGFLKDFGRPFLRDVETLKEKYGYNLKWKEDPIDFEEQIKKVELREIKYEDELEQKLKELQESMKLNEKKKEYEEEDEVALKKSRSSFIRMINSLGKLNYKIDKKVTTVEELSLMIKVQLEEVEEQNSRNNGNW